jgi:hypothetical protein
VAAADRHRAIRPVVGVAALPTPVNAPSLRKENKYKDSGMTVVSAAAGVAVNDGKVWGHSNTENSSNGGTSQPVDNSPETSTTTAPPLKISRPQNVWGIPKSNVEVAVEASREGKGVAMSSWADAESDEEEEDGVALNIQSSPPPSLYSRLRPESSSTASDIFHGSRERNLQLDETYHHPPPSATGWRQSPRVSNEYTNDYRGNSDYNNRGGYESRGDYRGGDARFQVNSYCIVHFKAIMMTLFCIGT